MKRATSKRKKESFKSNAKKHVTQPKPKPIEEECDKVVRKVRIENGMIVSDDFHGEMNTDNDEVKQQGIEYGNEFTEATSALNKLSNDINEGEQQIINSVERNHSYFESMKGNVDVNTLFFELPHTRQINQIQLILNDLNEQRKQENELITEINNSMKECKERIDRINERKHQIEEIVKKYIQDTNELVEYLNANK